MQLYRMPEGGGPAIPCTKSEAREWNTPDRGNGIFLTVNTFDGARRKENLRNINAWAIDMDDGTKEQQRRKLHTSPLVPTLIVETKRGYQAWWAAKGAKAENWNAVVLERLVPFFGADKNARDLCRILRAPSFLHLKDPADPFLCREVWRHEVAYTERQMGGAFKWFPSVETQKATHTEAKQAAVAAGTLVTDSIWDAIYALNCEEGLRRLSGHPAVGGESYTFKRTARDRLNILVNGKGCSAFIDENKRIGSLSGGGPTLVQWLKWFGADYPTILTVLKSVFPQLSQCDQRRAA